MASTSFEDLILRDIAANRPAFGIPGRLFYDTTNEKWQRDTGAAWEDCEPAAGTVDAADVTYTPSVLTDWDGDADPGDTDNALDQLAERVDDLEVAGGGLGTVLLDSVAGVGGVAAFTLSGIAAGYNYIEILITGKTERAATSDDIYVNFNDDATQANYRVAHSYGGSTSGNSSSDASFLGSIGGASDAAAIGSIRAIIHDYDGTTFHKSVLVNSLNRQTATAMNILMDGLVWESTSAITKIHLYSVNTADFAEGTRCTIIGW